MSKFSLYPLQFKPIFKEKIWGGTKIKTHLNKNFGSMPNCGESWEISGVQGDISVVSNGELEGTTLPELISLFGVELVGHSVHEQFGSEFPLLIKFIDANDDLSIQVHPNDVMAKERHNSFGKTEMWYIIQADDKSSLYTGFKKSVTKGEFAEYAKSDKVLTVLNEESVYAGDVFFLPSGRVHSIGSGILLAEIQQTSDVTYRVYDFDRKDQGGNKRELHISESLDVIDFSIEDHYKTSYKSHMNDTSVLVESRYFSTNLLEIDKPISKDFSSIDSFKIYMCLSGESHLQCGEKSITISAGETTLIPACFNHVKFIPAKETKLLECYIQG